MLCSDTFGCLYLLNLDVFIHEPFSVYESLYLLWLPDVFGCKSGMRPCKPRLCD